jgi:hypothetical protein
VFAFFVGGFDGAPDRRSLIIAAHRARKRLDLERPVVPVVEAKNVDR